MPDAVVTQIADAVVAELNGGSFGQPLTAQRAYVPVFDLGEMTDLHVTVVPKGASAERMDRSSRQFDYFIDVAVQKKLTLDGNVESDGLMLLVERISDYFFGRRPATFNQAVCTKVDNDPIYSPEHWREMRQFTSVLTLVFRVIR